MRRDLPSVLIPPDQPGPPTRVSERAAPTTTPRSAHSQRPNPRAPGPHVGANLSKWKRVPDSLLPGPPVSLVCLPVDARTPLTRRRASGSLSRCNPDPPVSTPSSSFLLPHAVRLCSPVLRVATLPCATSRHATTTATPQRHARLASARSRAPRRRFLTAGDPRASLIPVGPPQDRLGSSRAVQEPGEALQQVLPERRP